MIMRKRLLQLAEKKYELLKGEQYLVRKKKTMDYLMQKGFEPTMISNILERISVANKSKK